MHHCMIAPAIRMQDLLTNQVPVTDIKQNQIISNLGQKK